MSRTKTKLRPVAQRPSVPAAAPAVPAPTVIKAKIAVTPKSSILDPQGKTVQQALSHLGFTEVRDVRMGKYIEVTFNGEHHKDLQGRIKTMCERLLANPVIEQFHVTIEEVKNAS